MEYMDLEDPLQITELPGPIPREMRQNIVLKSEPEDSTDDDDVILKEETEFQNFSDQCSIMQMSSNYDQPADDDLSTTFTCKMCNQLYKIHSRSNLTIKGFCEDCLNKMQEKNILHSESISNNVCTISKLSPASECESENVSSPCIVTLVDCPFCSDSFRLNKALNEHLKIRNSGRYSCNLCNQLFCKSGDLNEHESVHKQTLNESNRLKTNMKRFSSVENKLVEYETVVNSENSVAKIGTPDRYMENFKKSVHIGHKNINLTDTEYTANFKSRKEKTLDVEFKCCDLCKKCIHESEFTDHMKIHEDSRKVSLRCRRNKNDASSESFDSVEKIKIEERDSIICKYIYKCNLCEENFESLISLETHLNSDKHTNQIVLIAGVNLVCKQCDNKYTNINELKTHLTDKDHIARYHIEITKLTLYDCNICKISFINKFDFDVHDYIGHTKYNNKHLKKLQKPVVEIKNLSRGKIEKFVKVNSGKSHDKRNVKSLLDFNSCSTCAKSFSSISSLKKHCTYFKHKFDLIRPERNRKFNCQHCNKAFNFYYLKRHVKGCQLKKNAESTAENKATGSPESTQVSIVKTSTTQNETINSSEFKCSPNCPKTFTSFSEYICHKLTEYHHLSKPTVLLYCPHCKTSLSTLYAFLVHCRRSSHSLHHMPKVLECEKFCKICNCDISDSKLKHIQSNSHIGQFAKFLTENSSDSIDVNPDKKLARNVTAQTIRWQKTCKVCSEKFNSRKDLCVHMRKHVGVQTHTCSLCKIIFLSQNKLKIHMKLSHEKKRFSCTECEKKFPYFYLLKLHNMKPCK